MDFDRDDFKHKYISKSSFLRWLMVITDENNAAEKSEFRRAYSAINAINFNIHLHENSSSTVLALPCCSNSWKESTAHRVTSHHFTQCDTGCSMVYSIVWCSVACVTHPLIVRPLPFVSIAVTVVHEIRSHGQLNLDDSFISVSRCQSANPWIH